MVAAALLGVGVSTAPKAKAANYFWDVNSSGAGLGGTGNWNTTSAFWTDSGSNLYAPGYDAAAAKTFSSADTAFFYGTAGTATLTGNITVGGLNFGAPSYTITTGTNTLTFGAADNTIRLNTLAQANATTTVGATITGTVAGTGNITLDGGLAAGLVGNTLTFNGTSTGGWSGATTINFGQTMALSASSQALLNTSGITLSGGNITLTNTTTAEGALNRISNTAPITSNGGTITYANTSGNTLAYAETIGAITLTSGALNLFANTNMAGTTNTQTLTIGTGGITRSGASNTSTLAILANTAVNATTNMFVVTGATATTAGQIIGPWFTTGTAVGTQTDYAVYNASSQVVPAGSLTTLPTTGATSTNAYQMAANVTLTGSQNIVALKNTTAATTLALAGFNLGTTGILNTFAGTLTISGAGNLTLPSATSGPLILNPGNGGGITVSSIIANNGAGALTLVVTGGNIVTLSGANTFTGGIVLNSGTLSYNAIAANTALGALANTITFSGSATLTQVTASMNNARSIILANGSIANFANAAIATTYSGAITGAGGVAINNTTNVATTFSGVNTFTGPINITLGYFTTGSTTATGNANNPVNIANAATTGLTLANNISIGSLSGGGSTGGLVTLAANTLTIGGNNVSTTFAGVISSSGSPTTSLIKTGTGILTLTGTNTFTGAVTISNGLVNISNVANLGSGTAIGIAGGGLQFSANTTNNIADPSSRTITINAGGATFDTNNIQIIFASAVGNSGTGGLTKAGPGTLFLLGANTYTGATTVNAGVLNLQNATAVSAGSSVTVASGGSLALQGGLNFGAKPLTLSGTGAAAGMSGALVNASGANTYAGAITLGADATVSSDVGSLALSSATAIAGTGFALTLGGASGGTVSSSIGTGAAGSLFKTGAGTWTLSGTTANYTGATSITGGTLSITGGALGSTSGTTLGGGTLALTSGSQNIGNLTVSAGSTNTVTVGASSTLTLGSTLARSVGGMVAFDISASGAAIASASAAGVLGYATINDGTVGMAYASGTNIVRLSSFSGGILADNTNDGANDYTTAGMAANPLLWSNTLTTRSVNSLTFDPSAASQVRCYPKGWRQQRDLARRTDRREQLRSHRSAKRNRHAVP